MRLVLVHQMIPNFKYKLLIFTENFAYLCANVLKLPGKMPSKHAFPPF